MKNFIPEEMEEKEVLGLLNSIMEEDNGPVFHFRDNHNTLCSTDPTNDPKLCRQYLATTITSQSSPTLMFAVAINSGDIYTLHCFFRDFLTPDAMITRTVYHVQNQIMGKLPVDYFTTAAAATATGEAINFSVREYECFLQNIFLLVPDMIVTVGDPRLCYAKSDCTVWISMFRYNGTLLTGNSTRIRSTEDGKLLARQAIRCSDLAKAMVISKRKFIAAEGSVVIYCNEAHKIFRIDLYCQFITHK